MSSVIRTRQTAEGLWTHLLISPSKNLKPSTWQQTKPTEEWKHRVFSFPNSNTTFISADSTNVHLPTSHLKVYIDGFHWTLAVWFLLVWSGPVRSGLVGGGCVGVHDSWELIGWSSWLITQQRRSLETTEKLIDDDVCVCLFLLCVCFYYVCLFECVYFVSVCVCCHCNLSSCSCWGISSQRHFNIRNVSLKLNWG